MRRLLPLLALCACSPELVDSDGIDTDTGHACPYPEGAVEPMALNEVLFPYSWPMALHADGRSIALDLADVFCNTTPDIDWSIHDLLLFVSIPAW